MDKKIVGLLGAAATLATFTAANATEVQGTNPAPAATYRDLLNPIPDAMNALRADDARLVTVSEAGNVQLAQMHHHHHHMMYRHHHHHHHHHVVPRVIRHMIRHHHHHHHHYHHHHHDGY